MLRTPSCGETMNKSKSIDIKKTHRKSAFNELGFKKTIDLLIEEIQALYFSDQIPWVIGYSGGKDSTAVVQLVWLALLGLDPVKRSKRIYVISTDTLVENPIVSRWGTQSL